MEEEKNNPDATTAGNAANAEQTGIAPDTGLVDQIHRMVQDGIASAMAAYSPPAQTPPPAEPAPPNEQAIQAIAKQLNMDPHSARRWFEAAALSQLAPQMPQSPGLQTLLDQRKREAQSIDGLRGVNGEIEALRGKLEQFETLQQQEKNVAILTTQLPALLEQKSPEVKILTDAAPTVIQDPKVQEYVIQELSQNRGNRLAETLRLIEALVSESRPQPRGLAAGPSSSGSHPLAGLDMSAPGAEEKLLAFLNPHDGGIH